MNKEVEKCKKKVCGNSYLKKQKELIIFFVKKMMTNLLKKKNISDEEKKKTIKNFKNLNKTMIKKFEKDKEYFKRLCINVYCNPKCKGTVFENGKEISNNTKKNL